MCLHRGLHNAVLPLWLHEELLYNDELIGYYVIIMQRTLVTSSADILCSTISVFPNCVDMLHFACRF